MQIEISKVLQPTVIETSAHVTCRPKLHHNYVIGVCNAPAEEFRRALKTSLCCFLCFIVASFSVVSVSESPRWVNEFDDYYYQLRVYDPGYIVCCRVLDHGYRKLMSSFVASCINLLLKLKRVIRHMPAAAFRVA